MEKITAYIADNQNLTKAGIIAVLNKFYNQNIIFQEFSTKDTLIGQLQKEQPQLLIIDFDLFDFNDVAELSMVKKYAPATGILIVTDNKSADTISKVVNAGINNYVLKNCSQEELTDAVSATLSNRKYFSNDIMDVLIERRTNVRNIDEQGKLTATETEIVRLIAQGLTTKEIAEKRNLSFHTIITHRKNIFRKLAINSTSELMMYAMRNGLIDSLEYYI
jgi:DNA-binding NarL/FixJ family response regulator